MDTLEIKINDIYGNWHSDTECTGQKDFCNSKFRIYLSDIYLNYHHGNCAWEGSYTVEDYWWICPVCGSLNEIKKKELPTLFISDKKMHYKKGEYDGAITISQTIQRDKAVKRLTLLKGGVA